MTAQFLRRVARRDSHLNVHGRHAARPPEGPSSRRWSRHSKIRPRAYSRCPFVSSIAKLVECRRSLGEPIGLFPAQRRETVRPPATEEVMLARRNSARSSCGGGLRTNNYADAPARFGDADRQMSRPLTNATAQ